MLMKVPDQAIKKEANFVVLFISISSSWQFSCVAPAAVATATDAASVFDLRARLKNILKSDTV